MTFDSNFASLDLNESLTRALADAGYAEATEVQARAIPPAIAGRTVSDTSSRTHHGRYRLPMRIYK